MRIYFKNLSKVIVLSMLLVTLLAFNALADYSGFDGVLSWNIDSNGTLTISGEGRMNDYTMEQQAPWYNFKNSIKTINIESGVTSIGDYAFYSHNALESITIPATVEGIGYSAFDSDTNLETVNLENLSAIIDGTAFLGCDSLNTTPISGVTYAKIGNNPYFLLVSADDSESCTVNDATVVIGAGAFSGNSSLESITIPDSVISIGDNAFESCTSLAKVTLGASVKHIGNYAFYDCQALSNITFENCPEYVGASAFTDTLVTGTEEGNAIYLGTSENPYMILWKAASTDVKSCEINENTKVIASLAFANCTSLEAVQFPEGLLHIGDSAFNNCSSLVSVEIPASTISLGAQAFKNCSSLSILEFGESVETIGNSAFRGASALTEVIFPDSLDLLGYNAFRDCTSLITVGNLTTSLGYKTFANCTKLKNVYFSDSFYSLGNYVFMGCNSLDKVILPHSTKYVGFGAFYGCSKIDTMSLSFIGEKANGENNFIGYIFGATSANDNSTFVPTTLKTLLTGSVLYANALKGTSISTLILDKNVISVDSGALNGVSLTNVCYLGSESEWTNVTGNENFASVTFANSTFNLDNSQETYEAYSFIDLTTLSATIGTDTDVSSLLRLSKNPIATTINVRLGSLEQMLDIKIKGAFELTEYSLLLEGSIGMKFYIKVNDELESDMSQLKATVDYKGITYDATVIKDTSKKDENIYYLIFYVEAKEMNTEIKLNLSAFGVSSSLPTSVKCYVDHIKGKPEQYAQCLDLVNAMYNYGQYSSIYFTGPNEYNTPTTDLSDLNVVISDSQKAKKEGSVTGISVYGSSLMLKSKTSIRHYFELAEGVNINDYTFKYSSTILTPKLKSDNIYYVEIENIAARNLGKYEKLVVSSGTESLSVYYSAMSYVKLVLENEDSTEAHKCLVKALYNYYVAATDYFNDVYVKVISLDIDETDVLAW